jgi:hypothetical protein
VGIKIRAIFFAFWGGIINLRVFSECSVPEKTKGGAFSTPPLILREAGNNLGVSGNLSRLLPLGAAIVLSGVRSAFLVLIRRAHGVNPTLVCFLFLLHDPCLLSLK